MRKIRDALMCAVFIIFIFSMFLLFIFLPKETVSVNEKRTLSKGAEISLKGILDGSTEADTEEYITDHFPMRNSWVSINSYLSLLTGRNGVNGVYKGRDGYLINTPVKYDWKNHRSETFEDNIRVICDFADKINRPVTLMIVPTAGSVMEDALPVNHAPYPDRELEDRAAEAVYGHNVRFIDLLERFDAVKDAEQLYYKTDHHWTSDGAYEAYKAITDNPKEKGEFQIEEYGGFFGTSYSKAALWHEKGEKIKLYTYPSDVTVIVSDGFNTKTSGDMFFRSHLDEPDKYPVYLDGNHSYVRIENRDCPGGRLLIIKDSYAHCLAPFLALHNNVTDMVDLRYYLDSVSELTERENYDEILIVYGISNLAETTDINILE